MPIIETQRPDIAALSGLHLWHAAMSNCSQRVRLVLEEKSLSWTSHLIDLFGFEHASADYQSIHPRGLVPALVHDGRTIIDSNDIIRYLDTEFPEPSLASEQNTQRDLMNLADACQLPLRTVSHELMLGDVRRLDQATLDMFGRDHANREFFQFLHRFSTEGFDDVHLGACLATLERAMADLDTILAETKWLAGKRFSLVDISWVVNVHRLARINYPLERHGHLFTWFSEISSRPSYERALLAWEMPISLSPAIQERRARLYARN